MNKITFHNRQTIKKQYLLKSDTVKCVICSELYNVDYNKQENAFMPLFCGHMAHRQCILSYRSSYTHNNWQMNCELCRKYNQFQYSALKALNTGRKEKQQKKIRGYPERYHRISEDDILKAIQKTGQFMYK